MWIFRNPSRYVTLFNASGTPRDHYPIQVSNSGRFFIMWNEMVMLYLEPEGVLVDEKGIPDGWTWKPAQVAAYKCNCCRVHGRRA